MEHKALMRITTTGILLALCGCGGSATSQTNNAAQSGAGASSPPASMSVAGTPAKTTSPPTAGRAAPSGNPTSSTTGMTTTRASSTPAMTPARAGNGAAGSGTASTSSSAAAGSGGAAATATTSGTSDKGSAGSAGTSSKTSETGAGSCLDGITGYDKDGPFMYEAKVEGAVNVWIPKVPAGCKVPIIHLANGTGANCLVYAEALTRMASHGFLATCYENPNTGSGQQSLMAFKQTLEMHSDIADMKFGSTGHSQGGQASFTGLQLAEAEWGDKAIYAGLAMEPASGFGVQPAMAWPQIYKMIKSPMFMFSGLGTDGLVSQGWVQSAFDALSDTDEAYFWTASGATHIPVPNGEEEEISIPWFRWKLLGDQAACKYFKEIPMKDMRWNEVGAKNAQDCK